MVSNQSMIKVPFEKLYIEEVPLRVRTHNGLRCWHHNHDGKVKQIKDLLTISVDDLLKIKNFSWSSVDDIQTMFQLNGHTMIGYELKLLKQEISKNRPRETYLRQIWQKGNKRINILIHHVVNNKGVIIINPDADDVDITKLPRFEMVKKDNVWELEDLEKKG